MKLTDKLTDAIIRRIKPDAKSVRLFDGKGLYLEVSPSGGKLWRMKYRFANKEKRISLGAYPDVSLKDARDHRDAARKMLTNNQDPAEIRKARKAEIIAASASSFEAVAREWYARWKTDKAKSTSIKTLARLEHDVFPWIGSKPVAEITAPVVLSVLRRIEDRGTADTAKRAKQNISMVMRYAIVTGRAERDPCPDLRGALLPLKQTHFASITEPLQVGELMRAIDQYTGSYIVRAALALAPLFFVRIGELRVAKWAEINLEKCEWRYKVSKTKTEHLVPLATQAVAILRDLQPLTGEKELVFPGLVSGRPISNSTINQALRRMGYNTKTEMTGHGFRAMARTLLAEELHFPPEVIEHQLAHRVPDTLGMAYNRTKFLPQRREMMQQWADYLDRLMKGADVIPFRSAG